MGHICATTGFPTYAFAEALANDPHRGWPSVMLPVVIQADPRMANFIGGFDAYGRPRPLSVDDMRLVADLWPTTDATPTSVSELLTTARNLFVHGYFVYEFMTVAVAWSLHSVEGALRLRLGAGRSASYAALLKTAANEGLLVAELLERLDAGRQLRNRFSHPTSQQVWAPGMAALSLATSHEAVAALYPDDVVCPNSDPEPLAE